MQGINAALIDTLAACGDVNRNVMAAPTRSRPARTPQVYDWSVKLSRAPAAEDPRVSRDLAGRRETRRHRAEDEPHLRPALSTAQVQDRRRRAAAQRRRHLLAGPRLHRHPSRTASCWASTSPSAAASARRTASRDLPAPRRRHRLPQPDQVLEGRRDGGHHPARLRRPHGSQARAPQVHDWRPRRRLVQGGARPSAGSALEPPRPFKFTTTGDRFGWPRTRWPLASHAAHRLGPRRRYVAGRVPHGPARNRDDPPR